MIGYCQVSSAIDANIVQQNDEPDILNQTIIRYK